MNAAVVLKVIAYAVVPLVMALIGNHLAAEAVEDKRKRRWYRIAFLALASVGILLTVSVEINGERSHSNELIEQEKQVEALRDAIQKNSVDSAANMAYLRAKLEAAEKMNERLAEFAPAVLRLALSTEEYTKKQYSSKLASNEELYKFTMDVCAHIREFWRKYRDSTERQENELMASMSRKGLTDAEKHQLWDQGTQKSLQLLRESADEFRGSILPDALYARQELRKRKVAEPDLSPSERKDVDLAFRGYAGGGGDLVLALGDYLELMAKQLPHK